MLACDGTMSIFLKGKNRPRLFKHNFLCFSRFKVGFCFDIEKLFSFFSFFELVFFRLVPKFFVFFRFLSLFFFVLHQNI